MPKNPHENFRYARRRRKSPVPLPPKYWEHSGEAPSFRLWNVQFENDIFSVDSESRLLLSLLGNEAISSFACTPEAQSIATTSFANFLKAAKAHFQPVTSPICAYFDFQSRRQQEGESASQFRNALRSLLVDCDVENEEERKRLLVRHLVFGCRDSSAYPTKVTHTVSF